MPPVAAPNGSTLIVYVPVVGSKVASTNPPASMHTGPVSTVVAGFRIETFKSQPNDTLNPDAFVPVSEISCPDVPENVNVEFWPGVPIVTVCAAPPMLIVPVV